MVQIDVLSGQKAGSHPVVRRFPFRIGRASGNDLQLEDGGVWDHHLSLEFQREGFNLSVAPDALVAINGVPVQNQVLRNGDIITVGSAKLQFSLTAARQRGLRIREFFLWSLIAGVIAAQFALLYGLIR